MLFLAKVAGIAMMVWFYTSAKKHGEPPIKWVVIGLIGYWLTWWLVNLTFVHTLSDSQLFARSFISTFLLNQIPAVGAIVAGYLIRARLIASAKPVEKSID